MKPPAAREKQRRDHMKELYSTLASLLHLQPYVRMSLPELLDQATRSLKQLKERVEGLKSRKEELEKVVRLNGESSNNERRLRIVQVRESVDMELEANLIIMVNHKKVMPFEVLGVIEQGGAEIKSATFCTVGHHIYCTVHAKAFQARIGFDVELIEARLLKLVY
ncbi:transcription factor bHLH168 [Helianthus annuus]|uniref:transcription factor bHLH168 n=1 Tax=Helianthus annuus TaxID=4232 RepID=UPI000B8F61F5|nr:transcription factor bHLH168 [Helianthus annuus]